MSLDLEKIGSGGVGKRAKDFPTLYDDNIDKIIGQFDTIVVGLSSQEGNSTNLEARVTVTEADIASLSGAIGVSENDISTLQTQLPAISAYLQQQIDTNTSNIANFQDAVDSINAVDTSLLAQISGNLQTEIDTKLDTSVFAALSGDTTDLSTYATISYVENISSSLQNQIDNLDTGYITESEMKSISANLDNRITTNEFDIESLQNSIASINAGTSGGTQGIVHITDVTNAGNIDLDYLPDTNNSVIDSFISDVSNVTIELTGRSLNATWFPQVEVNGDSVTGWTEQSNGKFQTTVNLTLSGSGEITAHHLNGTSHIITYSIATEGPSILSASLGLFPTLSWDGGTYQTELKSGDTVSISGSCENTVTQVEVVDDSGSIFASGSTSVVEGNTTFTLTGTVSGRTGSKTLKLRARNALGTYGATYIGETATLDQTVPVVGSFSITYPVGQSAIKGSETADVSSTVTNFTDIVYSSPNGDVSIPSTTTYGATKTVTRIAGSYNVSTNNYRITARKATNGSQTISNTIVFIADVSAVINVTLPASRLRSGGNDGTSVQNHTITATSSQRLASFSMTSQSTYGSFTGSWSGASNNTIWTRTLQVSDTNSKGSGSFQSVSAVNLAGIETTLINSGASYTLGGFVSRALTLPAFANTVAANVDAVDYSKVTLTWNVKSLPNKRNLGTTTVPDPNSWALTTLTPASVIILDTAATSSSSQSSTVTLEESV